MSLIDIADPELQIALDDFAAATGRLAEEQQLLSDTIRTTFALPAVAVDDGTVTVDRLVVGAQVKVAGEWHWVWAIAADGALLLAPADQAPGAGHFWYPPTTGERFAMADPF